MLGQPVPFHAIFKKANVTYNGRSAWLYKSLGIRRIHDGRSAWSGYLSKFREYCATFIVRRRVEKKQDTLDTWVCIWRYPNSNAA